MKDSAQEKITDLSEEPPGKLIVKISPHLKRLSGKHEAIKKQFYPSLKENNISRNALLDPLIEEHYLKTKGLYHKYSNRVLILLTLACASYCRFCTRKRRISELKEGRLNNKDIKNIIDYLKKHPQINETVFSGGDPLMAPKNLIYALNKIAKLPQIKIIRVHTRVPISAPSLVKQSIIDTLAKITNKAVYVSLHFEHPAEITAGTIKIINKLRKAGAILLSQSVFLKEVNDNYEILAELFTRLTQLGIRPYYIFHCDPVVGSEHFIVPLEKEVEIMTELRKNLSGIACPFFVIDTPNGSGKIPVPLNFWKFDLKSFTDYDDKKIDVID